MLIENMFQKNKLILILLWLFHTVNNYIWLKLDTYPLLWDAAAHFDDSQIISNLLKQHSFLNIVTVNREYSYFVPLITALFYPLFGMTADTGVFINGSIFLGVLIFSVYGIAKNIYSENAGLLASFLVTAYPLIFGHSRVFMYDLPLTAMVALSIYTFQCSDNFRKRPVSLLFGVTLGLGMLTKFTFPVFVLGAIFYYIYKIISGLRKEKTIFLVKIKEHSRQIINFILAILIAIILISTWYAPNLVCLIKALIAVPSAGELHPPIFSLASFSYYFFRLINYQISFFLFLVFIVGLPYFLKTRLADKLFLIYWILVSHLTFSFIGQKSVRYTLPYLPAIAIISAIGILHISHKKIRTTVILFIVIIAMIQFFAYSYGIKFLPSVWKMSILRNTILLFNQEGSENALEQHRNPRKEDWKTEEILNVFKDFSDTVKTGGINVFIIPDDPRIHSPLTSLAYAKKVPVIFHVGSVESISVSPRDYVITKDGNWMSPPCFMDKIQQSVRWFEENIGRFSLIKKINLPDKSNLLIYKRKDIS